MPEKYSDSELVEKMDQPGWKHDAGGDPVTGTLGDAAKSAHDKHTKGEHPGLIQEVETTIELDMLQLAMLWRQMGLPV